MGLGTRGEGGGLFVSHVNPPNLGLGSNRVGDSIQRVARESVNALYASTRESFNQQFRNVHSHRAAPFPLLRYNSALSPGGHFRHRPLAKVLNHHLWNDLLLSASSVSRPDFAVATLQRWAGNSLRS
jgi:hypothetical protein